MATLAATGRKAFTLALSFFVFPKPFTAGTIRLKIDGNKLIKIVGESQSCMVSKFRIIWKQTVVALASTSAEKIGLWDTTAVSQQRDSWAVTGHVQQWVEHGPAAPRSVSTGACTDNPTCAQSFCR